MKIAPAKYDLIKTLDGTHTLHSHTFEESCHSSSGAWEETLVHYFQGCEIEQKATITKKISILEIGFGTGLGFILTYSLLKKIPHVHLHFTSVEIDANLILWLKDNAKNFHQHPHITADVFDFLNTLEISGQRAVAKNNFATLEILLGDALITLKDVDHKFDAIYQDAFSPRKNPHLWSVEWFTMLKTLSHDDTLLSTYSSAVRARKSMMEAGWKVRVGSKFGQKKNSTRASITGESALEIVEQANRSPLLPIRLKDIGA